MLYDRMEVAVAEAKRNARVVVKQQSQWIRPVNPPGKKDPDEAGRMWKLVAQSWRRGTVPVGQQWRSILSWQDSPRQQLPVHNRSFVRRMLPLEFRSPKPELVALNISGGRKYALYRNLNV